MAKQRRPPSDPRPRKRSQEPQETLFLREWLIALGLRQGGVAADAEVNEGYVSQLVNREKWPNERPTVTTARRLADAMDMPWHLLYEPPPPDPIPLDLIPKYPPELIQRMGRARTGRRA